MAFHLDTSMQKWVGNRYKCISWLSLFNFLKRILIVPLFIWLPNAHELCSYLATEYPHWQFLPEVITSGPYSPNIDQTFALLTENPPIPFYILKFIFKTDKSTRKQNTWTPWFGLKTDCHYPIYSAWKTSQGEGLIWRLPFLWQAFDFLGSVSISFWAMGEAVLDWVAPVTAKWLLVTQHLVLTFFWKRGLPSSRTLATGIPNESVAQQIHFLTDFPSELECLKGL